MAEDLVLVEAAVLVLLPDDVVLPAAAAGKSKTHYYSLPPSFLALMARVAVKT